MKVVIVSCLKELIVEKFGKNQWETILEHAGFDPKMKLLANKTIDDADVLKVLKSVTSILCISHQQAADTFGEYWVNTYAPKIYFAYYMGVKTAKDFLLRMDSVHDRVTKNIEDAKPPRFSYKWTDEKTLIMTYKSERELIDIFVGIIKGVGKYFNEKLQITKLNNKNVKIVFQGKASE